jgi:hypothetical protein
MPRIPLHASQPTSHWFIHGHGRSQSTHRHRTVRMVVVENELPRSHEEGEGSQLRDQREEPLSLSLQIVERDPALFFGYGCLSESLIKTVASRSNFFPLSLSLLLIPVFLKSQGTKNRSEENWDSLDYIINCRETLKRKKQKLCLYLL